MLNDEHPLKREIIWRAPGFENICRASVLLCNPIQYLVEQAAIMHIMEMN